MTVQTKDKKLNGFGLSVIWNRILSKFQTSDSKIDALASGVKVSLSIVPDTVYKGVSQSITLTGAMDNGTPATMKLMDGNTELKVSTASPITHTLNVALTGDTKDYRVTGETVGLQLNATATVNARYPVYYGFGTNAAAIAVDANRHSATTTAAHTYIKTNNGGNNQYFYILVPSDISALSSFTMGGAPFVMTENTETINGISYKVYKSGGIYNTGIKLTVQAS